jgi:hypothetical protein
MKTIFTITLLFFTLLGFSQTTREEVVKRTEDGLKLEVNTYSGSGNGEKLIKKCIYEERPDRRDADNISAKPVNIVYYGNYKREETSGGETKNILCYGAIKWEKYDNEGKLLYTENITKYDGKVYGYELTLKFTILP